jgi:hypothetical protein
MRRAMPFLVSIVLASCGGSTTSSSGSPDGGVLASSDKDKCELYLTCLNLAEEGAYAGALALYGDTSACWQNSTTSANCASACVTAYAQIAAECSCTNQTSCTLCKSADAVHDSGSGYNYTAVASAGATLGVEDLEVGQNVDGSINISFDAFHSPSTNILAEVEITDAPMTCGGVSMLTWSHTGVVDYTCPDAQTGSGTLTADGSGTLMLTFTVDTTCMGTPMDTNVTGTFTLTPQ